jgi:hypothetical protein
MWVTPFRIQKLKNFLSNFWYNSCFYVIHIFRGESDRPLLFLTVLYHRVVYPCLWSFTLVNYVRWFIRVELFKIHVFWRLCYIQQTGILVQVTCDFVSLISLKFLKWIWSVRSFRVS